LYDQDWTFMAMDRGLPIESFDPGRCWVLPTHGGDAVYEFPPYDVVQPGLLLPHLPPTALQRPIVNGLRQPVLIEVRVPAADLPSPSTQMAGEFGGQIGLVRIDGLPSSPVKPGSIVPLTLVWQSLAPATGDYTAFLHADDVANHVRAQQDHAPCDGSFPTYRWSVGEQVFDRYSLKIPDGAASATYQITAGLYQLPGPKNVTLANGDTELKAGSFEVR
jgi:hypothetical protein